MRKYDGEQKLAEKIERLEADNVALRNQLGDALPLAKECLRIRADNERLRAESWTDGDEIARLKAELAARDVAIQEYSALLIAERVDLLDAEDAIDQLRLQLSQYQSNATV